MSTTPPLGPGPRHPPAECAASDTATASVAWPTGGARSLGRVRTEVVAPTWAAALPTLVKGCNCPSSDGQHSRLIAPYRPARSALERQQSGVDSAYTGTRPRPSAGIQGRPLSGDLARRVGSRQAAATAVARAIVGALVRPTLRRHARLPRSPPQPCPVVSGRGRAEFPSRSATPGALPRSTGQRPDPLR